MKVNETIDRLLGHQKVIGSLVFLSLIFAGFQHNSNFWIEMMALVAAFLTLREDWSWLGYIALGWVLFTKLSIWQIPMGLVIYLLWRRASLYGEIKIPRMISTEDDVDLSIAEKKNRLKKDQQEQDAQEQALREVRKRDDDDRHRRGEPTWWD